MRHRVIASSLALGVAGALLPGCSGAEFYRNDSFNAAMPMAPATGRADASEAGFQQWVGGFRARAMAQGISPATLNAAFVDTHFQPDIIAKDRNQSEFTKSIWDYLDSAASPERISSGQAALARNASTLARIEARYGVPKEVVVAVWGMESNYGTFRGKTEIIPALATLAYDGRRGEFFEGELMAALRIVQAGDVGVHQMTGSWAGAMGHTQFMPSSFLAHAVDFNGDGRRDIWSDDPTDALASTASYLAQSGWQAGQPWGLEVRLPASFDMSLVGKSTRRPVADWSAMGVRPAAGGALPAMGPSSVLLPAGVRGPAFLIGPNFAAITRYNAADSYVLGVGHLSDRIAGKGPFVASWPRDDRALTKAERQELQERLTRAGYDTQGTDGKLGPKTLDALRAWQMSRGLTPDGYASSEVLDRLRRG